jgi:hypothetical protein
VHSVRPPAPAARSFAQSSCTVVLQLLLHASGADGDLRISLDAPRR